MTMIAASAKQNAYHVKMCIQTAGEVGVGSLEVGEFPVADTDAPESQQHYMKL
jgi:hypothetical protein